MRTSTRVFKNAAWLSVAQLANPVLSLVFVMVLSRKLGPDGLGVYSTALTLFAFFNLVSALGLNEMVIRDVAADKSRAGAVWSSASALGTASSVLAALLMLGTARILDYPPVVFDAIAIVGPAMWFYTIALFSQAILQSFERMELCAFIQIGETVWKVLLGVAALTVGLGIRTVMAVLTAGHLGAMVAGWWLVRRTVPGIRFGVHGPTVRNLMRHAPTFLSLSLVVMVYWSTDVVMLSKMRGVTDVGFYSAGYRLLTIGRGLVNCYTMAVFPVLSVNFARSIEAFRENSIRSIRLLCMATFPVASAMAILADKIMPVLYGKEFLVAVPTLQVLIWPLVLFPIANMLGNGLIASHRQRVDLWINAAAAAVNVVLNFFLIRKWGHFGAGLATFLSIWIFVGMQHAVVSRTMFRIPYARILAKPVAAALGMAGALVLMKPVHPWLGLLVSAVVYVFLLVVLKAFDPREIEAATSIWKERKWLIRSKK